MNAPTRQAEAAALAAYADRAWDERIVPALVDYIAVPAKSPMFDADWQRNGHIERVVRDAAAWVEGRRIAGLKLEVIRLEGRTPLIFFELPASGSASADPVLLYGHLDKQPEFSGWRPGLGPWTPKYEGGLLYGRGGADDGYAIYAAITALEALQAQGLPHPRCVGLIETCEESGSGDLPAYIEALKPRLGQVGLVVCLDSGAGNYDQLWLTTSLRGMVSGVLKVEILSEGVHSGDSSGVVPSSFRILRQLLSRIEDQDTGRVLLDGLHVEVPADRMTQAKTCAEVLGTAVYDKFPFLPGMTPMHTDLTELVLNRTWRPALSITGVDGMPPLSSAGNVLRPYTSVKLSLRLPPTLDGKRAGELLSSALLKDPPNGAQVTLHLEKDSTGWNAPTMTPWLEQAIDASSREFFGKPAMYMGEGGTIPFMGMLGEKFPGAQFMITGVLGPHSNAHGPNEFLDIPMGKRVTSCVARVLAEHRNASVRGETTGVAAVAGGHHHGDHGCC